jgi:hypothetical protein
LRFYNEYKEVIIFTMFLLVNSGLYAVAVAAFLAVFSPETVWGHQQKNQQLDLPDCPADDNGEVILFPKPENCSEFYQCAGGHLFTHHCPDNLYYCAERNTVLGSSSKTALLIARWRKISLNLKKISLCRLLNPYALHRLMGTSL